MTEPVLPAECSQRCVACHAPIPPETLMFRQPDSTWRLLCQACGQWQLPAHSDGTGAA